MGKTSYFKRCYDIGDPEGLRVSSPAPAEEAPAGLSPPSPPGWTSRTTPQPRGCDLRVSRQNHCPRPSRGPAGSGRHPSPGHRKARFPQPPLSRCASERHPRVARVTCGVLLSWAAATWLVGRCRPRPSSAGRHRPAISPRGASRGCPGRRTGGSPRGAPHCA